MSARDRTETGAIKLSTIRTATLDVVATAMLVVETQGREFTDITEAAAQFVSQANGRDGVLHIFVRHTSASLVIQENADPDVQTDLVAALDRIAPEDAGWVHDAEGPDDMPAHVKAMVTGVSLSVPVIGGKLALGTWQGVYLVEHRARPHRREVVLQFLGAQR